MPTLQSTESALTSPYTRNAEISVKPANEENAPSIWAIYHADHVVPNNFHPDKEPRMAANDPRQWRAWIRDKGQMVVSAAIEDGSETPAGIGRLHVVNGLRMFSDLSIATRYRERRSEISHALVQAAVVGHRGEAFHSVIDRVDDNRADYEALGFKAVWGRESMLLMLHPGGEDLPKG